MTYKPGSTVPTTGIYWCSVCKTPGEFTAGSEFPECPNMCSRGRWEPVKMEPESNPARG